MASNFSDRQRVSMTDKRHRRQGVWQEKGMTPNLRDRQGVRMADNGNGIRRSVTGKGNGKQFKRQTRGDNGRQGERETSSVGRKVE